MRIGIDVSQVVYGTGVSTYTRNLVRNLLKIDKENEYILFGFSLRRKGELYAFFDTLPGSNCKKMVFSIPPTVCDLIWNRLHILQIEKMVGKIDVFHSSDWTQPPSSAFKVTTVHDLVPIKYPELSHPKIVRAHQARLKWVQKEADRVIAPSKATKHDLMKLGFDKRKVIVIPEAPEPEFKPASPLEIDKVKRKYKIMGRYALAVGTAPRKNINRIINAVEKFREKNESNLALVIAGMEPKLANKNWVFSLGYVPNNLMPALYSGAEVLVFPSLYEGFGLPTLEAFACKTPVVTSNLGSLKEVAGESAVLVNPRSIDSIVDGLEKTLKASENYIKKGVKRVKKFNWETTARETLKIYLNRS